MAERPILFSGPMVRAILDGTKTQTRRVVKPQPRSVGDQFSTRQHGRPMIRWPGEDSWHEIPCPYGVPGDTLWVRETWAVRDCGRGVSLKPEAWPKGWPIDRLQYVATDEAPAKDTNLNPYWWNSRPSIHMPRWASRILLTVTDVRVERLQEISEEDARAEGVHVNPDAPASLTDRSAFAKLWDSINAKRGHGWDSNPWVWVVSFERKEAAHG